MGRHDHPEVSLHSFSLAEYMKCIDANDWAGVAELMLRSAEKLAKAGADFLICPTTRFIRRLIWWSTGRSGPGCTLRARSPPRQQRGHSAVGGAGDAVSHGRARVSRGVEGGRD